MNCACYLRDGKVYIPTMGRMDQGFYREVEPVAVVAVSDTNELHAAFSEAFARGNPNVPRLSPPLPAPILLKYASLKSWSAFARTASTWGIEEREGVFQIRGYRKHSRNGWVVDDDSVETFARNATANQVIQRMIAILQEAAAEQAG